MCGIVAVLSRPPSHTPPAAAEIRRLLGGGNAGTGTGDVRRLAERLGGPGGLTCLVRDAALRAEVAAAVQRIGTGGDVDEPLADALWSIGEDRLATAQSVADFIGPMPPARRRASWRVGGPSRWPCPPWTAWRSAAATRRESP